MRLRHASMRRAEPARTGGPHTRFRLGSETDATLEAVRIVITTAGSRGDVAPYTGLARRLDDAGHTTVIATHEPFRGLVEAHGIEFAGLAADPREILGTDEGRRWQSASGDRRGGADGPADAALRA